MANSKSDIRVKLVTRWGKAKGFPWTTQCPGRTPRWDRCEFTSDPFARDYDWLVAVDDIPRIMPGNREELACPRDNTILVTSEPSSVTRYGKSFAAQFGHLLTNQEEGALPHPRAIRSQTGNIWFYGKSYDEIKATAAIPKSELISTVCSSKRQPHTMHARRYDFTWKLKKALPELEIFGHGVRFVEKKHQALDPYQFHLVVENQIGPHLWTEKLADAFLAETVPIYCGCPNVFDYFPKDSLIPIDINDFEGSLATIRSILSREGEYERRREAVLEAKRLVMDEYNLPAMLNRIILDHESTGSRPGGVIYNRRLMRMRHPADFLSFAAWKTGNLLKSVRVFR
ncbi:glycosyltransferase family 10 domain-containing protein [Geothermobacter hydrogeniphilus]|uniref:Fucosyltransferase C-terminal domain-containing protein n=1 Tax=Geothermobacter hydrogeniphilus TaxID=1969733 RepID=A0A1X0Y1H2_9BACT|nr:glycosyltransferase family 10 [Geothermobacter hydrogeniphilus]ORJ59040.1 hypothetical protein B5V00_10735 [Geothermobacter hydrogeniphilus]